MHFYAFSGIGPSSFGGVVGVTVLVVGTEEFEPLVIFSNEDSAQRVAFAAMHWTLVHLDPFVSWARCSFQRPISESSCLCP